MKNYRKTIKNQSMEIKFMTIPRIFPVAATVLALAGCTHVPVKTMWDLRRFDPMTADPALLRVAFAAPAVYAPRPGGAKMTIFQARRSGRDRREIEIVLEEVSLASETCLSRVRPKVGQVLHAYRIPQTDIPRLVELRREALARAAEEPGAFTGSFSVGVDGCRVGDVALPDAVRVSTWIRTGESDGYIPLIEDFDLVAELGREKLMEKSPACTVK
jgi:hypothetical protein